MARNGIEEMSEAVQNLILNAHALGPTLSYQAIQSLRHTVQISENVARIFRDESLAELKRDSGDEIIAPNYGTSDSPIEIATLNGRLLSS